MRGTLSLSGVLSILACAGVIAVSVSAAPALEDKCANLLKNRVLKALPNTTFTSAQTVMGSFMPPGGKEAITGLPSFCRVAATLKPAPASDVKVEVWMPTAWNGKLEGIGNAGLGGAIAYNNAEADAIDHASLVDAVKMGYAGVSTDTGHVNSDRTWLANEDKERDYGYRAIHAMTVTAKAVTQQFYGSTAKHTYFNGCSTGGGQALGEAQQYPEDYDGILAGSPQNYLTHTRALDLWKYQLINKDPQAKLSKELLSLVTRAVMYRCGQDYGADKDGFLSNDPRECWFGPEELLCNDGDDPATCLNPAQAKAIMKMYEGYWIPGTHLQVMPGFPPGSEGPTGPGNVGWGRGPYLKGTSIASTAGSQFYLFAVLQKPDADLAKIDIGEAVQMADQKFGYINHTNPDLSGFIQRGGKLLIYHGWNDPDVPVYNSINYYSTFVDMLQRTGKMNHADALAQAQKSVRLFTAPGMGHCGGGPGPNSFDTVKTLDQWVDQGVAPEKIVATHAGDGETTFSRPLCPYPQYAQYSGKGDRKDAASWTCVNEHWNWALYDRYFYAPDLAPKERQ